MNNISYYTNQFLNSVWGPRTVNKAYSIPSETVKTVSDYLRKNHEGNRCSLTFEDKNSKKYCAWFNSQFGSFNIQPHENFIDENNWQAEKIGIQCNDQGEIISIYVDGSKMQDLPENKKEWILNAYEAIKALS